MEKSMANSSSRSFNLDDIHAKQTIGYELIAEYVVVSQQEFLNYCGTTHKSKDPRNLQGKPEVVYPFRDPSAYRKLRLISSTLDQKGF